MFPFLVFISFTQCYTLQPPSNVSPIGPSSNDFMLSIRGEPGTIDKNKRSTKRRQDIKINIFCSLYKSCLLFVPFAPLAVCHTSKNFNLAPAATKGSCHIFRKSPYRNKRTFQPFQFLCREKRYLHFSSSRLAPTGN